MSKIPSKELIRIKNKIDSLGKQPRPIDTKKIQGDDNLYRVRIGNYRVLYRIFDEKVCVLVMDVDHRKDIYRNL